MNYENNPIIYGLEDPISLKIRYIEKSICGNKRPKDHIKPSSLKEGNTPKNNWIKQLISKGLKPNIIILESFQNITNDQLYRIEQDYIKNIPNLLNLTDGGPGAIGRKISEETRQKMSKSAKLRPLPKALLDNQKPKNLPKKKRKQKSRIIPGAQQKYADSMKISVIVFNLITKEEIIYKGFRDAAKIIGGKCNHCGIQKAIKNQAIYYNFSWKLKNV